MTKPLKPDMPEVIWAYQSSVIKRGWYDFSPREETTKYLRADIASRSAEVTETQFYERYQEWSRATLDKPTVAGYIAIDYPNGIRIIS